uniref:nucleolin-like isoform X1 n=1 Tax=Fragaria vesca subsp. vesca TaxID=101020 RepID=UPI0005C8DC02|nr:PREDICTED: nucleolin-like isoform X1 [Fragaria vesca subsp. vesca]
MAGSSTSSLNARALALRMKMKEFLRKRARSEVSNEEVSVAKAATHRRSPRSTRANEVAHTSKDAPNKARVVQPRRSPRSTKATDVAQSSKDAPSKAVVVQPRRSPRTTKATDVAQSSKDAPSNISMGPAKATKSKKSVASKKLSFGSMSNSGSGKRKAGKSKAGMMEVVDSDDEDEELDNDEDEEESDENVTGGLRLLRRGMVTMSRVNRRLVRGRKLRVKYNDDGEPVGRAANEMQSYIGVLVRTKVPINVKDWRLVALSVKDNIWGSVEVNENIIS